MCLWSLKEVCLEPAQSCTLDTRALHNIGSLRWRRFRPPHADIMRKISVHVDGDNAKPSVRVTHRDEDARCSMY